MKRELASSLQTLIAFLSIAGITHSIQAAPAVRTTTDKNGSPVATLRNVARYYNMKFSSPASENYLLNSQWSDLQFEKQSRKLDANNMLIWLHEPLTMARRKPALARVDLHTVIDPLLRPDFYLKDYRYQTIMLDPGHGGRDTGTRSKRGTEEKDLVLELSRSVRRILANAGYRVRLTRDTDRFLTLDQRCASAKKNKADLFVSIHMNSSSGKTASGIETFVLTAAGHQSTNDNTPEKRPSPKEAGNRHDEANSILGYYLHKNLLKQTHAKDRGLKRARFFVLKNAPCPAALIECGFLSNSTEAKRFQSKKYKEKTALAIAEGIMDYLDAVKRANALKP